MKTKLNKLAALAVAATFFTNVASAEIKAGPLTLTPGIIFESSKITEFAGIISNRSQASAGVDLNISHNSGIYLYSAYKQDRTSVSEEANGSGSVDYEFCNSLGFAKSFDKLNLDLSFENCNYEGSISEPENAGTYYAKASYNVNDKLLVGGAYALSDTEGDNLFQSGTDIIVGDGLAEDAFKFYGTFNAGPADITLTYGEASNLTDYYKVGLSKEVVGINFDLSYWDVSGDSYLERAGSDTKSHFDREFLVLTAKKIF